MTAARTLLPLAPAALALSISGCHAALEPTARDRHNSFALQRAAFRGDTVQATLQTYLVIGAGAAVAPPTLDRGTGSLRVAAAAPGAYAQGLAVGVDPSGYLLTARHILRERTYVVGWMNGRLDILPGRVVAAGPPGKPAGDIALIAVDATLDFCARFGAPPARGDTVFAVVCDHSPGGIGGELGMAAGTVLGAAAPGAGRPLIATDVPLWYGDSGGPLLSAGGELVGLNSAIHFAWAEGGQVVGDYVRYSCPADGARTVRVIAEDRAARGPPAAAR
jgi:S1-C subfamily serine protease